MLLVPENKFGEEFIKPVATEVATAIESWLAIRPESPKTLDPKTLRLSDHLYVFRGRRIGLNYLNEYVIPLLLRKAGLIEWKDRHGGITSHRMRATMATALMDGPDGMSLIEMARWLGHKGTGTVTAYATVKDLPGAFARAKSNLFKIQVILDQEAVLEGVRQSGRPYLVVDVGEENGACPSLDRWRSCSNNLDCLGPACEHNLGPADPLTVRLRSETNALRLTREILLQQPAIIPRVKPKKLGPAASKPGKT